MENSHHMDFQRATIPNVDASLCQINCLFLRFKIDLLRNAYAVILISIPCTM
jgi:hypothetical protein